MLNKKILLLISFVALFTVSCAFACNKNYKVLHENGLYMVKVNLDSANVDVYLSDGLETVDKIAQKTDAFVAINAGFFDAKNKKTVSYVAKDGDIVASPEDNEHLTSNENLKPHLSDIFNRAELRLYNCDNKIIPDIVYHNEKLKDSCILSSSVQAGPMLLPDMDLAKEYFVIKKDGKVVRDGAGMTRKTDRSMIAIKNRDLYFIITDEENPLTIYELQNKIKSYNFDKALGFDGGGSVSLFVKTKDGIFYQDREEKGASRAVKSALIVR